MGEPRRIFVLSTLKRNTASDAYEEWARDRDIPHGLQLPSVNRFEIFKVLHTLDSRPAPYQYVEVVDVSNLDRFMEERQKSMSLISREFEMWAQRAVYLVSDRLGTRSQSEQ